MTSDIEAMKALEPFAKLADTLPPEWLDSLGEKVLVPIGDLRRAREAYRGSGETVRADVALWEKRLICARNAVKEREDLRIYNPGISVSEYDELIALIRSLGRPADPFDPRHLEKLQKERADPATPQMRAEQIDMEIDAIRSANAMEGWRPIETRGK